MRDLIKAFKALSDETRIRILGIVLERECCVCEVMQALEISQTRASRNLRILQDAGFLKSRKEGLWCLYSIDQKAVSPHVIAMLTDALEDNDVVALDRERLKKAERIGPACAAALKR